ncbi:hypothetical protein Q4610_08855 [Sphingobium sp. HBC34]|uniref:Uncharacterized protein n=1 Tax=Sphingobium cyanobacteriorum TaxID=3063954 RepID=A0ABT8ZKT9_9SPHN|nr:hypothetical protein [Sphingobium sp. HBC34]MDO7835159.1 hypothetical protein [Sphingobium sp. HBC34]
MITLAALLLAAANPVCAAPAPLAEPWTSWRQSGQAKAGILAQGAPALILGKPLTADLTPAAHVQFPVVLGKGAKEGHGGLFSLSLKQAARVGIALSGPAWVDVVTGNAVVASVAHGHGPDCSGIRKIVWFDLPAGRHIVQVAGAKDRSIHIMAADATANQPL